MQGTYEYHGHGGEEALKWLGFCEIVSFICLDR